VLETLGFLVVVLFFFISYLGLWNEVIYWVLAKLEKLWWK